MAAQALGAVVLWLIVAAIAIVIAVHILRWLYRRSTKDTAFVRTGFLGEKVVVNGGAFVIPVLHDVMPVNMNVMRIEVSRSDHHALITKNRIRVDLAAEFFVRVGSQSDSVAAAAQTLGRRTLQPEGIRELLEGKFAAAMRTVAAQMMLEEMHERRKDYAQLVKQMAAEDLARNGLELESVAIVDLDQTGLEFFNPSNAFDAEGLTQLTEVIEARRRMRNEIEQRTQVDIRSQNLDAQRKVLEIDREGEFARLEQEREIEFRRATQRSDLAKERALRDQESEQAQLASREEIEKARLAHERSITEARIANEEDAQRREVARRRTLDEAELKSRELTEHEQIALELSLETARVERERTLETMQIAKRQAFEEAEMQKTIDLAKKSAERSVAIAAAETARAKAVQAEEQAFTAREREIAERRKMTELINTQRETERDALRLTAKAEAEKKAAAGFAEAQIIAAQGEADSERIRVKAAAERYAVDATGQKQIAEAENALSDGARQSRYRHKLLDRIEGIVRESVRPMEKIDGIKILHVDGLHGGAGGNRTVTDEVIDSALRYRVQAPMIDNLMKDIGIEGGSLGRMTDVLRDAKDIASLTKDRSKSKPAKDKDKRVDDEADR